MAFTELIPEDRIGVRFEGGVFEEFITFKDLVEVLYGRFDTFLRGRARDLLRELILLIAALKLS